MTTDLNKRHRDLDLISQRLYGHRIPDFIGSPLEGMPGDICERVLHEICHQVFLDMKGIAIGNMDDYFDTIVKKLDELPKYIADLHEIRTLGAELLVAKKIGLHCYQEVMMLAEKNLSSNDGPFAKNPVSNKRARKAIRLAMKTEKVKFAAMQVVELFKMQGLNL